jgi:putative RNA 2'-phosphotransferase
LGLAPRGCRGHGALRVRERNDELSKVLSHALRHEPWLYELELDDEGWASLEAVLGALREKHPEWRSLSRADVERMIVSSSKRRHEVVGDRIRALYGHSVPGKLRRERRAPPAVLFHGTSADAAERILGDGLRPIGRQYVHLSLDTATAREVGRRKSETPVLIEVKARDAHEASVIFYEGNERVWLADFVPCRFLRIVS